MKKQKTKSKGKSTNNWKLIALCIAICEAAGIAGSIFTANAIPTWYKDLIKPDFAPPNWLFGPVWTFLYACMGITLSSIWKYKHGDERTKSLVFFIAQLVVNVAWSIVFFGMRNISLGLYVILSMWGLIVMTIWYTRKIDKEAAYLLVPYLMWVTFASLINYELYLLN